MVAFRKKYSLCTQCAVLIYSPAVSWWVNVRAVISSHQPCCIKPLVCARCCFRPVVLDCRCWVSTRRVGCCPLGTTVAAQRGALAEREKIVVGPLSLQYSRQAHLSGLLCTTKQKRWPKDKKWYAQEYISDISTRAHWSKRGLLHYPKETGMESAIYEICHKKHHTKRQGLNSKKMIKLSKIQTNKKNRPSSGQKRHLQLMKQNNQQTQSLPHHPRNNTI